MNRLARMVRVASGLSLVLLLSNCSNFDPTDIMDNMFAAQKKPLPGDRKPLFPDGTPGVTQGLPPDLVKGYQPPPPSDAAPDTQAEQAAAEKPKPKPKPKPQPKVSGMPPANQSSSSAAPPPAASRSASPQSSPQSSPWPDPPPTRSAAPQSSPWPDPPPTRQSAAPGAGQTVWPDPPAPTTVTR
jgi:hypothetical protein